MPDSGCESSVLASDLTAFQLDLLVVLAEEARSGLAIKRELEAAYGSKVNSGLLYPYLNALADIGLVEKRTRDGRTNEYALTAAGKDALLEHLAWVIAKYVTDEARATALHDHIDTQL